MKTKCKYKGFSLTEVMMAVGILAVGMVFIGGVFPVAIHFSTVATERTTAAVVADEAFAKIKLYGINFAPVSPPWPANPTIECVDFADVVFVQSINVDEFAYPSISPLAMDSAKQYCWSALCRRTDLDIINRGVQVTVFVCRMTGTGNTYWDRDPLTGTLGSSIIPVPVRVGIATTTGNPAELRITDLDPTDGGGINEASFINDGCKIVDDMTGRIYRVLERYPDRPDVILLDEQWPGITPTGWVWVIPAPQGGGRYPCIEIYQKLIQF